MLPLVTGSGNPPTDVVNESFVLAILMTDDQNQIARFRSGRDQAVAEAMAEHTPRLRQIVELRIDPRLSGRLDATDVLQEAFLEACKRLPRYLDDPSVSAFVWLRGVVMDTLCDFHRRHLGERCATPGKRSRCSAGWDRRPVR